MDYTAAHKLALENFQKTSLQDIGEYSGYPIQGDQVLVEFLGQKLAITYPTGEFHNRVNPEVEIPLGTQILILHYLVHRSAAVELDELISYKELPGGSIYIEPFTKRAINPLLKAFGKDPKNLVKVGLAFGGEPVALGDGAVKIRAFPKIPITLVVWGEDEEFSASGNILFDRSAGTILHTEDYALLASLVVYALAKESAK